MTKPLNSDFNATIPLHERLLRHCCLASRTRRRFKHQVVRMDPLNNMMRSRMHSKGNSAASGLHASPEATCAMAACAASRETVNRTGFSVRFVTHAPAHYLRARWRYARMAFASLTGKAQRLVNKRPNESLSTNCDWFGSGRCFRPSRQDLRLAKARLDAPG